MYGGSGKIGRGGGSAGKRNIHAPLVNRRAPAGRLSMGGGTRGPGGASSAATYSSSASSLQVEESFSLVRENPLNFGMAIKLAPDLVEEIKRVEAQGGTARIKFDANSKNPNGNVIQVGDKNFKFTWSREPGDLCDIYEERRCGEDGNGLLVESGGTWRKLNVERELDESTKNHVKRRSEEAERKMKSRKVQVLDPSNPSMKNQMRDLVVAESNNTRRNFKHQKEPPFKKLKSEPPSGGPPKSIFRSGIPTTTLTKSRNSLGSPLSSQPDQSGGPASPLNFVKGHASAPDVVVTQNINKTSSSDKEMQSRLMGSAIRDKFKHNQNMEAKPADLRSLMISLLQENQHKGMNLKALEKAVGDALPNSVRQIEPVLKQIATFQAPGKYFLKPGVETESFKKPLPQSGSSPEINRPQSPELQKLDQVPGLDPSLQTRTTPDDEQGELNSTPVHTTDVVDSIDILNNSPYQFSDKKVSDNSEGLAGSSSDSGSDSDSDSDTDSSNSRTDSGSQSKSKSRSPVGSHGRSSSDSDSDGSSSSKQASDEDVDIMTSDDEKESKHKLQHSDPPPPSKSPVMLSHPDDESVDIENDEKQDGHDSDVDVVDFPKDYREDDHHDERPGTLYPFPNEEGEVPVKDFKLPSADNGEGRQLCDRKASDGPNSVVSDGFKQGQSVAHEGLSKCKSKRHIEDKHSDERAHSRKKLKSKNTNQPVSGTISSIFGESPDNSSPDRPLAGPDEGLFNQMMTRTTRDDTDDHNFQTGVKSVIPARSVSDYQQPAQFESHAGNDHLHGEKRPSKRNTLDHGVTQTSEGFRSQKGSNAEAQGEDGVVGERRPMKFHAEGIGDKHETLAKSRYRKPEKLRKPKEAVAHSKLQVEYSHDSNTINIGRSPLMNGQGAVLQREYSDLELGEFREPLHDEAPGAKKQSQIKSSNKHLKSQQMDSEYWNSDFSRGKPLNKVTADLGKSPQPNSEAMVAGNVDGSSKRKSVENYIDDLTRPQQSVRPMHQYNQSRVNHTEVSSQNNKVPEINIKSRSVESGAGQLGSLDAHGDASRKVSVHPSEQRHNAAQGNRPHVTKESRKRKSNAVNVSNGRRKDTSMTGSYISGQKSNKSSSDEIDSSYTKYEKEEPELKAPIKDIAQYRQYVEEYQEKYESYCSLNKIFEFYRDEFSKYRKDLEACQGRDMKRYNDILEQMRSSFRQCGERHKRLKKIFIMLYEELKHLKQMITEFASSHKRG